MILCSTLSLIRHLICGNSYSWFLNLNLIYKILQTGAGSGLLISVLEKLVTGAIDVKMDVLEEKSSFQILGFSFSSKLVCGSYIVSVFKTVFEKIGVLIHSIKFFSPVLYLYKSTIWLYVDTAVMSELVLQAAKWICQISYKNRYLGPLVLYLQLFLNPWVIFEMQLA